MPLLIGLHALKQEVIDRMPLRRIGGGWALDGGGNARGVNAIDLQTSRASADQVASGDDSFIGGGQNNTASGVRSAVFGGINNRTIGQDAIIFSGEDNYAYGNNSIILAGNNNNNYGTNAIICAGSYNTISTSNYTFIGAGTHNLIAANGSFIGAGSYNTAGALYTSILAGLQGFADKRGQTVKSSFCFAAQGDAQSSLPLVAGCITANNTPEELFLDGDGGSARCIIASDTTWMFHINVVARRTDADNESAAYNFLGCIDNNAGTTALVGSVTKTVVAEDTSAWDCNVTEDNANGALIITATGENAKTIQWVASIFLTETTG
jgi:hypothetical protein